MTTLHLGVIDIPYADEKGVTTGDVAEFLEDKYHVMGAFYGRYEGKIANALANALAGALETVRMGGPLSGKPFATAESEIAADFKHFLSSSEIETMGIEGVPTKAALDGKSKRFKRGRNKGKTGLPGVRRPSFIDTGLYQASFVDWVT